MGVLDLSVKLATMSSSSSKMDFIFGADFCTGFSTSGAVTVLFDGLSGSDSFKSDSFTCSFSNEFLVEGNGDLRFGSVFST